MSDSLRLGDIIDLVGGVKQVTSLLDGGADHVKLRDSLTEMLGDRKALIKFAVALKKAKRAADALANSPLGFVGGLDADDEPEAPEPGPIPRRAQRVASDPKQRRRVMGDEDGGEESD